MSRLLSVAAIICTATVLHAEGLQEGVLPFTHSPRIGNNLTILSDSGERFEGRAWYSNRGGYFCFSGASTSCGGKYDASSMKERLVFVFSCIDGRIGKGVATRVITQNTAEVMAASGEFSDGTKLAMTFGPTKEFRKGVGCSY